MLTVWRKIQGFLNRFFSTKELVAFIFVTNFIILLLHIFKFEFIRIDTTAILLLTLMVLTPFASQITRIRFGEFEAEKTVSTEKVAKELAKVVSPKKDPKTLEKNSDLIQKKLNQFFAMGLHVGSVKKPPYTIDNIKIYKDKNGKEVIQWEEQ